MNPPKITIGTNLRFQKNSVIFSEGDLGREMYVVSSGIVRIFITTGSRHLTLSHLKKGDFFGEMALLEALPRSASAEAAEDCELVALREEDFKFLIQQHPEIAMKVLGRFSKRLRDADHLIELLLLGDLTGQVINKLVNFALLQFNSEKRLPNEWFLPIDVKTLAEDMKMDIDTLEKVLADLERLGLVVCGKDGLILKGHKKLRYYIEYLELKSKA